MNTVKSILIRSTMQAVFGLMIVGTLCFLAIRGDVDGPSFLGVGLAVVAWLYRQPNGEKSAP